GWRPTFSRARRRLLPSPPSSAGISSAGLSCLHCSLQERCSGHPFLPPSPASRSSSMPPPATAPATPAGSTCCTSLLVAPQEQEPHGPWSATDETPQSATRNPQSEARPPCL